MTPQRRDANTVYQALQVLCLAFDGFNGIVPDRRLTVKLIRKSLSATGKLNRVLEQALLARQRGPRPGRSLRT